MHLLDRATIMHYHRHRIATFGEGSVEALGWRARESQTRRFEVIADALDLDGATLLDVGCGHGDLRGFLDGRFTGFDYVGIDQMPEFIRHAREAYGSLPRTSFFLRDFTTDPLPEVDYVVACGSLNYRCDDPAFPLTAIRSMWNATRRALFFNVLDAKHFPDHPLLVGRDREQVLSFCGELSASVHVLEGTPDDDLTVCLRRLDAGNLHPETTPPTTGPGPSPGAAGIDDPQRDLP